MADMGEDFREWSRLKKERRASNLDEFQSVWKGLFECMENFVQRSPYHYQFTLNGMLVDYWPTSNRWYIKDLPGPKQSFNGTPTDLLNFVRKRIGSDTNKGPDLNAMTLEEFEEYAIETIKTFCKWWKLSQQASTEGGGHTGSEFPGTMNIAEWFEQYDLWSDTEHEQRMREPNLESKTTDDIPWNV